MHPPQPAGRRELAQVAPEGVLGGAEFDRQLARDEAAFGGEALEQEFLALGREHALGPPPATMIRRPALLHEIARNCTSSYTASMTRHTQTLPVDAAPAPRVRILAQHVLSDDWYVLKKTTFDYRRRDGTVQRLDRETYDRGNGATLLLFNARRGTVVLTRQFRFPAYVNGLADGMLVEACAGLLDGEDPSDCIRREAEEETGFVVRAPRRVFEAYMSPGSVTEKLHFFVASYEERDRVSAGGGKAAEGEDIEVMELPLARALEMIATGEIQDAKTVMLLQHAALQGLDRL
jgi:nudix-type nucleoside diphosphatase (YffH/AdpP family)